MGILKLRGLVADEALQNKGTKMPLKKTNIPLVDLAPVVERMEKAIHWINHYPGDSVVYLSGG